MLDPRVASMFREAQSGDLLPFRVYVRANNPGCVEALHAINKNLGLRAKVQVIDIDAMRLRPPPAKDGHSYVPTIVDTLTPPHVFVGTDCVRWITWRGEETRGGMPVDGGANIGNTTYAPALSARPMTDAPGVNWTQLSRDGNYAQAGLDLPGGAGGSGGGYATANPASLAQAEQRTLRRFG